MPSLPSPTMSVFHCFCRAPVAVPRTGGNHFPSLSHFLPIKRQEHGPHSWAGLQLSLSVLSCLARVTFKLHCSLLELLVLATWRSFFHSNSLCSFCHQRYCLDSICFIDVIHPVILASVPPLPGCLPCLLPPILFSFFSGLNNGNNNK